MMWSRWLVPRMLLGVGIVGMMIVLAMRAAPILPSAGQVVFAFRTSTLVSHTLFTMDIQHRTAHALIQGAQPDISPVTGDIVFTAQTNGVDNLYIMSATGRNVRQLTHSSAHDVNPAWSPDGRRIVFQSTRSGTSQLYVIDADGENLMRLTHSNTFDGQPTWSPDGERIAFSSDRTGYGEIFVIDADGSHLMQLTTLESWSRDPAWSPDGQRIAFMTDLDYNRELVVVDVDGSNLRRLTTNARPDQHPVWSPDGRHIMFDHTRGMAWLHTIAVDDPAPILSAVPAPHMGSAPASAFNTPFFGSIGELSASWRW